MFRTELSIAPVTDQLSRTARVLTVGSCFADSIGARLAANKVETLANPFGTVFQPLALARLLRAAAGEEVDWQQHLVEARGRWQSYDLHGSIGADSPVELLQTIQGLVQRTGEFLRNTNVVLVTLGTAWAYRLRETGELVSNCHKQSDDFFVKELLTPDEIINALAETHAYLRRINPALRFVLTVSPVRHLKDTLPLNAVSKSVLRVATHILSDLLPDVVYFPAYEVLMDDLRDYRFYAADMLHPSEVAQDYVWEKFARTYFDADFGRFRKEWAGVRQLLDHRPLHAGAPEYRQFLENTQGKLEQLALRKVDVGTELAQVRTQLATLPLPRKPEAIVDLDDDEERIDIGKAEDSGFSEAVAPSAAPAGAEERLPRLSPEEFRAQRASRPDRSERGRRDGRGKGQQADTSENEQFQATGEQDALAIKPFKQPEPLEPTEILTGFDLENAAGEEIGKKKKRRSRGGAKRTARKNALRLAAGEIIPAPDTTSDSGNVSEITDLGAGTESSDSESTNKKSTVITKSVPVKRGGLRNEPGHVPRVPLFTPELAATNIENPETASAGQLVTLEQQASAAAGLSTSAAFSETGANVPNSRNDRNSGRRSGERTENIAQANRPAQVPGKATETPEQAIGKAPMTGEADITNVLGDKSVRNQQVPAALTSSTPATTNDAVAAAAQAAPAAARAPRRAKARAISAARAEKPAIDTPIIPISDAARVRTQVAAGRLTGSAASLVAPTVGPQPSVVTQQVAKAPQKQRNVTSAITPSVVPRPVTAIALGAVPTAKPAPTAKRKGVKNELVDPKITLVDVSETQASPAAKPDPKIAKRARPVSKTSSTTPAKPVEDAKPAIVMPTKAPRSVKSKTAAKSRVESGKAHAPAVKSASVKTKPAKPKEAIGKPEPKITQELPDKPISKSSPKPVSKAPTPKPRKKPTKPA